MWDQITALFSGLGADETVALPNDQLQVAVAALLIHATFVDGYSNETEMKQVQHVLKEHFQLSSEQMVILLAESQKQEKEAVDLYRFTRVLKQHLDQDGRQCIVEMLWEIVLADNELHEFENNMVWRVSELLGVSTRDRIALKKKVESKQ
ncbi:MAG: TerB family tellurite resistance protein [Pseudomonadota bacterium]